MRHMGLRSIVLLSLLLLMGLGIRFYRLGFTDTRSDEVALLIPPLASYTPAEHIRCDWQTFKETRIMPVPRMTVGAFITTFKLEANRFNVRFVYALLGGLTVGALFLLGRAFGDGRLAWLLAFFGAINPFSIYYSRQAHVYAFPIFFNTLAAAFGVLVLRALAAGRAPRARDLVLFTAAAILACHTHMSSWPLMGLLWLVIAGMAWRAWRRHPEQVLWIGCAVASGVWLLALVPWIYMFISAFFTAQESFLTGGDNPIMTLLAKWRTPFVMTWGGGWPRALVSLGLLLSGIGLGLRSRRWRYIVLIALGLFCILAAVLSLMMGLARQFFNMRYYTPLWLILIFLSTLGVLLLADWLARFLPARARQLPLLALVALVGGLMVAPLSWLLSLPGNPVPYTMANRWMDTHLPPGAPVVVDRWFQPWNEMLHNAPTNVVATFTIPNEPQELLLQYNWTQTVQDFMRKYPEAAYLEVCFKSPYGLEAWEWPRQFFHQQVEFRNEPGLKLRQVLLSPEENFYQGNSNGLICTLHYNTREDVLAMAAADKARRQLFYGPEWGYVKLWQQLGDFRDWRVLREQATLEVYNLTSQTNWVNLTIRGMALNGSKRVIGLHGATHDFQHLLLEEWSLGSWALQPGLNRLLLRDPFWNIQERPFLMDEVWLEDVPQAE